MTTAKKIDTITEEIGSLTSCSVRSSSAASLLPALVTLGTFGLPLLPMTLPPHPSIAAHGAPPTAPAPAPSPPTPPTPSRQARLQSPMARSAKELYSPLPFHSVDTRHFSVLVPPIPSLVSP
jgi:hypothetical protein